MEVSIYRLPIPSRGHALILSLGGMVALSGCAAHTSLVPVGAGRMVPNVGFGGPIVAAFGAYVPIPYVTVGADYGVSSRINLNGTLHVLPLAYRVAGVDAGFT